MASFGALRTPRKIIFGKGQRGALGGAAKSLGARAFVCTDSRMTTDRDFVAMMDDLNNNGVSVQVYDRTIAEIPLTCVADCVASAAPFGPDLVIGIGGGSCMDLAKAVAVMLAHGGNIRDYYGEFQVPGPVLPLILVPTTSGTGSEVTPVAVLSDPDKLMKVGIASPHIISHTAICDPELTYSCPASLTAIAGADALTHAIEAFTAIRRPATPQLTNERVFIGKNALSDHHALIAIERISRSLARACSPGHDEEARDDMMLGALSAGLAFGTAGTAAAHAIQYPIGAFTHTPHGTGVALLMPYVMDFNRSACVSEFAQIAMAMGSPRAAMTDEQLSGEAIRRVAALFAEVCVPSTLAELGVPADKLDWIAEQSFTIQRLVNNNPKALDVGSLSTIVKAAFAGILIGEAA
ncbi:iron-containing alcohol dehydrogenase [Bosea lathyri]|uniref:Alcohol dehydrogenase n=1 Tax=Bosea lathyri TaxID=1036778 RepID=A0A1H6CBR3_9HYPH|nr:iron-containing alcohol dehydrogenase [Bosea lathyri]SEG69836.1 alcohol dehydrogenase [Bosea lathyri]